MNYFLVDSPLQLLNAIEAQNHFNISKKDSVVVVLEGVSEKNFQQIQSLIVRSDWSSVYFISKNKWKIFRYKSLYLLNKIINGDNNIEKVFIGDYRSNLMRHFVNVSNCNGCYLLDDGSASIFVHEKIEIGQGIKTNLGIGRKIAHWIINLQDEDIFNIKYFTIYGRDSGEDNDRVIRNKYRHIKSMVTKLKRENSVYFLGNCLPELNIIGMSEYLSALDKVKNIYSGEKIYYVPHRREDYQKVKQIEKNLGFSILDFNLPIEWALIKENKLPYKVASFYSSALDNCHEIFGKSIDIEAFKVDRSLIKKDYRAKFDLIFEGYKNYKEGFSIVEI